MCQLFMLCKTNLAGAGVNVGVTEEHQIIVLFVACNVLLSQLLMRMNLLSHLFD
ncbi:MAG: hypothetical protein ACI8RD_002570 [Bacillariaceae sp.]|jgi:hypothetical protein